MSTIGPRGARVAAYLVPLCGDDLQAAADLPAGWLSWAADVAALGPNGPAELLAWRESLFTSLPVPVLPGARGPVQAWVPSPVAASTFAARHPRRPANQGWIEVLAARRSVSGAAVAVAFDEVFLEAATLARFNVAVRADPQAVLFTFAERCRASGCEYLAPAVSLDSSVDVSRHPSFQEPPAKRIALAARALLLGPPLGADPRAVRPPASLAAEAGVRTMMASVARSWKSYRSGLRCWSAFMDAFFPSRPHFPAEFEALLQFAPLFRNSDTLRAYHGHIRFAERLLGLPSQVDDHLWAALLRGARRFKPQVARPRFLRPDVVRLVRAALAARDLDLARVVVIARCWLFRVSDELLPLQLDGRSGLEADDTRWHSVVSCRPAARSGPASASVRLRTRKNAPFGERIARACTCTPVDVESRLLCGPCSLRAAVSGHVAAGRSPRDRLFGPSAELTSRFRRLCGELGLPPAWHAFRRGAASDMLRAGSAVGDILLAGSWRSGAFLRYLRRAEVDARAAADADGAGDAVLEAVFAESGSE